MYGRLTQWFRAHPWIGTAFFGGVLMALVILQPVFPYQLPESTANVAGAALGALFAVCGAAWLADHKERHQHVMAARAIAATVFPVLDQAMTFEKELVTACRQHAKSTRDDRIDAIRVVLNIRNDLQRSTGYLAERLDYMNPLFLQLGGNGVLAQGQLSHFGPYIDGTLDLLEWTYYYDDQQRFERDVERLQKDFEIAIGKAREALQLIGT